MNAPEPLAYLQAPATDPAEPGRSAALNLFELEKFQDLSKEDLLLAQSIAGHGDVWGIWETPRTISPGKIGSPRRVIDFAKRLRDFLAKEPVPQASLDVLVEEGVLVITRLALLLRLAPTGGQQKNKNRRLKPSTLVDRLYQDGPKMLARAIRRKAERSDVHGLFSCLTEGDVRELSQKMRLRIELERLAVLADRGWWTDLPPHPDITQTTDPRGPKPAPVPQEIAGEWQPIPDAYLAEFGPRNLWLIRDLGPCLLPMLEDLAAYLESLDWSELTRRKLFREGSGLITKWLVRGICG